VDDLEKISDQELLDALKRRQKRLNSALLGSFILAPAVGLIAWRSFGPLPAAGLGFGVLLGGLLAVFLVARRLTWSRLDLLAFERGLHVRLSTEAVKHLTAERLEGVDAPRCVLHLQGAALPQGNMVSVVLRVGDKSAEIETRAGGMNRRKSSVPLEEVQSLREKLETAFDTLKSAERFPVRDGFPCELIIGLRDPVRVRRFECNLADPDIDRPIVQLARALWSLADMPGKP